MSKVREVTTAAELFRAVRDEEVFWVFPKSKKVAKKLAKEVREKREKVRKFRKAFGALLSARSIFDELGFTKYADHVDSICKHIDEHIDRIKQDIWERR